MKQPEVQTLTALRGIMALWVVALHYGHHLAVPIRAPLHIYGFLAVDVFFVLSGFILYHVHRQALETRRLDMPRFLLRRLARLYPVHLVTMLAALAIVAAADAAGQSATLGFRLDTALGDLWANLALVHGLNTVDALRLNYPSWSISTEMAAYVAFPAVAAAVLALPRRWAPTLAALSFLLMTLVWETFGRAATGDRALWSLTLEWSILRIAPEFLMGAAFARAFCDREIEIRFWQVALLVVLMLGALQLHAPMVFVLATPWLITALFFWRVRVPGPLRWLGLISYSLYMVHALVEMLGFWSLRVLLDLPADQAPLWSLPLLTLLAIPLAAACRAWVELPGHRAVLALAARARLRAA